MTVNAPARPRSGTMDIDEFMAFIAPRPKEERWHLIEGIAVMMAPPSLAHQWIARNLCELLNRAFAAQGRNLFAYHSCEESRLALFDPQAGGRCDRNAGIWALMPPWRPLRGTPLDPARMSS